jgi:hypothetical protein
MQTYCRDLNTTKFFLHGVHEARCLRSTVAHESAGDSDRRAAVATVAYKSVD